MAGMSDDWTEEERRIWQRYRQTPRIADESVPPSVMALAAYIEGNADAAETHEVETYLASIEDPLEYLEAAQVQDVSRIPPVSLVLRAKSAVQSTGVDGNWLLRIMRAISPAPAYGVAFAMVLLTAVGGYHMGVATFEREWEVQASIDAELTFGFAGPMDRTTWFN